MNFEKQQVQLNNKPQKTESEDDYMSDLQITIEYENGDKKWKHAQIEFESKGKSSFQGQLSDLEAGKTYSFKITAQNQYGSVTSDAVTFTLTDGLPDPPNLSIDGTPTNTSIKLQWKFNKSSGKRGSTQDLEMANNNSIQFKVWHDGGSNGKNWVEVEDEIEENGKNTFVVVTGLAPSTEYKFKAITINEFGESQPSKIVTNKTAACK